MGVNISRAGGTPPAPPPSGKADQIEARSHKISLFFSILALTLMLWGLAGGLAEGRFSMPGAPVTPMKELAGPPLIINYLWCMSSGIVLLGILPVLKVAMSAWKFVGARETASAAVALIVLMELAFSILVR